MNLSSITLHHLVIPLARPFATTTNQVSEIHALLTEVTLSNGLIAQSFIYGLGKVPLPVKNTASAKSIFKTKISHWIIIDTTMRFCNNWGMLIF